MSTRIDTELFCLHCDRETSHTIVYMQKYIHRIVCNECGTEIAIDRKKIIETYTSDVIDRVLTKPRRITEEMRKDLTVFITSLPIRIITKPIKMAKEIMDVVKD